MIFYTDGSASPTNPGPGGFGVVILNNDKTLFATYQSEEETGHTTNNREELKAILWVLKNHGKEEDRFFRDPPIVYSDSQYCVSIYNDWLDGWAARGWKKSDKKVPENLDLLEDMYDLKRSGYSIDLRKVRGHDGEKWNELADKLAKMRKGTIYNEYR